MELPEGTTTSPSSGFWIFLIILSKVDLPAPFLPTSPILSLSFMINDTRSNNGVPPNCTERLLSEIMEHKGKKKKARRSEPFSIYSN
jgi:hypothetical protein